MKILTGTLRVRAVLYKPSPLLRPTSDKARKAIFDVLRGALEGAEVLDLFSGTGALGFEALSGGAERVFFVESDVSQARRIRENLDALGLRDKAVVLHQDAGVVVRGWKEKPVGIIFLDPPYSRGLADRTLGEIAASRVMGPDTLVAAETRRGETLPERYGALQLIKLKTYGDTSVRFYRPGKTVD